jgi:hypothetical protein
VIDLDIQQFFDTVPWDLVVRAVQANTDLPWVVLYVRRWLRAPLQLPDGTLRQRSAMTERARPADPVADRRRRCSHNRAVVQARSG